MPRQLSPKITVKQKISERLEIEVCSSLQPKKVNCWIAAGLYCVFTLLSSGFGMVFFGLGQCLAIYILASLEERIETYSIQFDTWSGDFSVLRKGRVFRETTGKIADIQSISIYPVKRVYQGGAAPSYVGVYSHSVYGLVIQTERKYQLKWKLSLEEGLRLANEIQSWFDSAKSTMQ